MPCPHLHKLQYLQPPRLSQSVHREECTQCFDDQDTPDGVDVCLTCFNGGCLGGERHHARTHVAKSGHRFTVNVKRVLRPLPPSRAEDQPPPHKLAKLAIVEESDADKYEVSSSLKCWECDPLSGSLVDGGASDPHIHTLLTALLTSPSSARQSEVKAWEEEIVPCEHTLMLEQLPSGGVAQSGLAHCAHCTLTTNLWLCLTCGSLGCGRAQFGGTGGNGHAMRHFEETGRFEGTGQSGHFEGRGHGHAVAVKLGTITPEGSADVYCYACNDSREDPEIARHLAAFGINVRMMSKTEKSMTELQIEHNLKYDFSLTSDSGRALEPLFGPSLTGLANLGNSCYLASVLQCLVGVGGWGISYGPTSSGANHAEVCTVPLPAECVECQMRKVADGLMSGRYSVPAGGGGSAGHVTSQAVEAVEDTQNEDTQKAIQSPAPSALQHPSPSTLQHPSPTPTFQTGLKPTGLKALLGKGHAEFGTMRQQDAEEFLGHVIGVVRRDVRRGGGPDPSKVFSYATEQRLECASCRRVSYRTDCLDVLSVGVPALEKGKDVDGKVEYGEVGLMECLRDGLAQESLEYVCEAEGGLRGSAIKQTKLASLPEVLIIHAKKFQLVNWVPTKLDVPVILPENDEIVFRESDFSRGIQPGEVELPSSSSSSAPTSTSTSTTSTSTTSAATAPEFNPTSLAQLETMGFPTIRAQKALLATGNADAEAAMEWLFAHMDDGDIDEPIQAASERGGGGNGAGGGGNEVDEGQVGMLADMGFTSVQARKALRETGGNAERAVEWLFSHPDDTGEDIAPDVTSTSASGSQAAPAPLPGLTTVPARYRLAAFISHKGPSVHSGHYVAHIKKEDGWVLFNDEKVVRADEESVRELKRLAYLYWFVRV